MSKRGKRAAEILGISREQGEIFVREADKTLQLSRRLKPGEPCDHPGCLSHITHPCDGCGRYGGHYKFQANEELPGSY